MLHAETIIEVESEPEYRWRVVLTNDIAAYIFDYRALSEWLHENMDYEWKIANKNSLGFCSHSDAMMFYLRFK